MPDRVAVLVPVKAFGDAKLRLSPALDAAARAELAREMATVVVRAAGALHTAVVCDDEAVREWAHDAGAEVIWRPGRGLNGAVVDGVEHLAATGFVRVIVAHGDLPLASGLAFVAEGHDGVTIVPDRHRDGTNVVCLPTGAGFEFAYGPGSFERHSAEAARLGLPLRVLDDERLGWDVDVPTDLAYPQP